MAILRPEITRVVPPFRLKVRMIEMIARKLVVVAGQSALILSSRKLQTQNQGGQYQELIPHGSPLTDSVARQRAPDTVQR